MFTTFVINGVISESDLHGGILIAARGTHEEARDIVDGNLVSGVLGLVDPVDDVVGVEHDTTEETAIPAAREDVVKNIGGPQETKHDSGRVSATEGSCSGVGTLERSELRCELRGDRGRQTGQLAGATSESGTISTGGKAAAC